MRVLTLALLVVLEACATAAAHRPSASRFDRETRLRDKPFTLHLSRPSARARDDLLVLYASGDGGWFGAAVDMFRDIGDMGYPAVGISSRAYTRLHADQRRHITPADLATDYQNIISDARVELGLTPGGRVIATGWSRGAAFAVLVGTTPMIRDQLAGIVAIGLAGREELDMHVEADDEAPEGVSSLRGSTQGWDPYQLMPQLGSLPCAVIQASGDGYLSAAEARGRFGADSPSRRLFTVEARNHRFSGGQPAFRESLREALAWIQRSGQPRP